MALPTRVNHSSSTVRHTASGAWSRDDTADPELVPRIRAGDAHAFAVVFERYYEPLCTFAENYLFSGEEAEEIVEDVFLRIWEFRAQWQPPGSIDEYLYAAVRNRAVSRLRRSRVRRRFAERVQREGQVPATGEPIASVESIVVADELRTALNVAIGRLPPRCREVFLLRRQHNLGYAEIARAMGTSVRTIENQIGQAHKLLRAALAKYLTD